MQGPRVSLNEGAGVRDGVVRVFMPLGGWRICKRRRGKPTGSSLACVGGLTTRLNVRPTATAGGRRGRSLKMVHGDGIEPPTNRV